MIMARCFAGVSAFAPGNACFGGTLDSRARIVRLAVALAAEPGRVRRWLKAAIVSLGLLEALSQMHDTNPDAISYLDLGSAFWRGDPVWINGLWSPLYGIVCVGISKLLHLPPAWEYAVCHLVNFLMYALALLAFDFFLSWLLASVDSASALPPPVVSCLFVLSYAVFLEWNHSLLVWLSPDLAISACFLCAVALLLRIRFQGSDSSGCYLLGAVLGTGYLAKTPVLPLGVCLLLALTVYLPSAKRRLVGLLQASFVFMLLAGLYIVPLSLRSGKLTSGESAKLNYAWHVQGVQYIHWQGDPVHGHPVHPTRQLMDSPQVFGFGEPLDATYAAYYDPSFWFVGLQTPFSLRDQAAAVLASLKDYGKLIFTWQNAALLLVIVGLLTLDASPGFRGYGRALRSWLPLLLWAVFGMALFGLVHVEERYVTAFPAVAWPLLLAVALAIQPKPAAFVRFLWWASAVVLSATLIGMVPEMARGVAAIRSFRNPDSNPAWVVARQSRAFGLKPGDRIAALGVSFHHAYWARPAGYRIVAEMPKPLEYWTSSEETQQAAREKLRSTGALFLIAIEVPPSALSQGWRQIGSTSYFILPLP